MAQDIMGNTYGPCDDKVNADPALRRRLIGHVLYALDKFGEQNAMAADVQDVVGGGPEVTKVIRDNLRDAIAVASNALHSDEPSANIKWIDFTCGHGEAKGQKDLHAIIYWDDAEVAQVHLSASGGQPVIMIHSGNPADGITMASLE